MNKNRASIDADSTGCTGKDVHRALNILDADGGPDLFFVENLKKALGDASKTGSLGRFWRDCLVARNFTHLHRQVDSSKCGGPEKRIRHYEMNIRKEVGLGIPNV